MSKKRKSKDYQERGRKPLTEGMFVFNHEVVYGFPGKTSKGPTRENIVGGKTMSQDIYEQRNLRTRDQRLKS